MGFGKFGWGLYNEGHEGILVDGTYFFDRINRRFTFGRRTEFKL